MNSVDPPSVYVCVLLKYKYVIQKCDDMINNIHTAFIRLSTTYT